MGGRASDNTPAMLEVWLARRAKRFCIFLVARSLSGKPVSDPSLSQVESKEEHSDRPMGPQTVVRPNGLRAADQPVREVDITYEMQRKVPHYSLHEMRSGIDCKAYGDKAYKHPEYSDRFFKMGQLVVGAGFTRGHYKKTEPRNAISVQLAEVVRKEGAMTFDERQAMMAADEARAGVEGLTRNWERSVLKTTPAAAYDEPSDSENEEPC